MASKVVTAGKKRTNRTLTRAERYQKVFSGPDGEWVLHDLMAEHHLLGTTLNKGGTIDVAKEGERVVVLRILAQLRTDVAMLRERIEAHEQILDE